jgi:hypothetical protein
MMGLLCASRKQAAAKYDRNMMINATSRPAAITPLTFLHADPTRRRRRLQAAHKRRLLAGLELEGNLNTLGCAAEAKHTRHTQCHSWMCG